MARPAWVAAPLIVLALLLGACSGSPQNAGAVAGPESPGTPGSSQGGTDSGPSVPATSQAAASNAESADPESSVLGRNPLTGDPVSSDP